MGFTIMESFMDQLTVRSQPGKGTAVRMKNGFRCVWALRVGLIAQRNGVN